MPFSNFAETIYQNKYAHPGEIWEDTAKRVANEVMGQYMEQPIIDKVNSYIERRVFMPGGRYLYAAGRDFHQTQNCLLLTVGDSREEWASLMQRVTAGLMTGAGVGIVYSSLRENGAPIRGTGGISTGPIALMQMVNESGRFIMQGGSRRSAIWAGLHWNHPDIMEFIHLKDWNKDIQMMKEKDFNTAAPMDGTNISVILDDDFFESYHDCTHPNNLLAHEVYDEVIHQMLKTGEPGFSVDVGNNAGEHLRNACTEITSSDDNDICNLGSINIAACESLEEFQDVVMVATAFLLCGTMYSLVPYAEVADTRTKNRRLGLGLMGIYEWLAERGLPYEENDELGQWLSTYKHISDESAKFYAEYLEITRPIKVRAIAPTGTIGILAETTTGIEPMFGAAYKRRYLVGNDWHYQYVVDETARRLFAKGVDPDSLETAYSLAEYDPMKRVEFQAWVQQYVDHGISSTINLPAFEDQKFEPEDFGDALISFLPKLRGITVYPDGARSGQPLTVVSYQEAKDWEGFEYAEVGNESSCKSGVCGV